MYATVANGPPLFNGVALHTQTRQKVLGDVAMFSLRSTIAAADMRMSHNPILTITVVTNEGMSKIRKLTK